ncbi:hypothetical protein ACFU90_11665 [Streptomyces noursei]
METPQWHRSGLDDRKALAECIRALPAKEKDALLLDAALGTAP